MSFSSEVKDELARVNPESAEIRRAELSAMLLYGGKSKAEKEQLLFSSEHAGTVRKYFTLVRNTYKISDSFVIQKRPSLKRAHAFEAVLSGRDAVQMILEDLHFRADASGDLESEEERKEAPEPEERAFLRGAFLAAGSLSDPEKSYHLEFVCSDEKKAGTLKALLRKIGAEAGIVGRKRFSVVYLKDSSGIVDALGWMGAPGALMEMENVRILKEMRNSVNRQVNCEAANISKTVSASMKQVQEIEYIRDTAGLDSLPDHLREMAEVRLQYPEAALKELGEYLNPPVGKSGVNHRLRKLSEYAGELRGAKVW
ncbi:MAG: DNA-binding protein WhiA [Stomatobaculum sp.]|nr:DNA-binding protein WhiA [Stomatobaculum sp.]